MDQEETRLEGCDPCDSEWSIVQGDCIFLGKLWYSRVDIIA